MNERIEYYLEAQGYGDIPAWHKQIFRNYDSIQVLRYGDSEAEQLYSRLVESGRLTIMSEIDDGGE